MSLLRKVCFLSLILFGVSDASAQQKAPDLLLKDINGKTINIADLRGKVILVNFWATWCAPCRTEIPDLVRKQREYQTHGLHIIGITYPPEELSDVRRVRKELKMNYPVIIGSKETKSAFTSSETLPLTVVIDRDGNVREVIEGIMYSDEFEQKVKPLLLKATPREQPQLLPPAKPLRRSLH